MQLRCVNKNYSETISCDPSGHSDLTSLPCTLNTDYSQQCYYKAYRVQGFLLEVFREIILNKELTQIYYFFRCLQAIYKLSERISLWTALHEIVAVIKLNLSQVDWIFTSSSYHCLYYMTFTKALIANFTHNVSYQPSCRDMKIFLITSKVILFLDSNVFITA